MVRQQRRNQRLLNDVPMYRDIDPTFSQRWVICSVECVLEVLHYRNVLEYIEI